MGEILARRPYGIVLVLAVIMGASSAEGHSPPPGSALQHTAERAGHVLEVMVVPRQPRSGEPAEVILTLRERATGAPYQGYVTFLLAPPGGEAEPLAVPVEFGPGQFETAHVFRQPGPHALSILFEVGGTEQRVGPIAITVRPPSRVAGGVAVTLTLVTALTYAAAFRRSRRRALPEGRRG